MKSLKVKVPNTFDQSFIKNISSNRISSQRRIKESSPNPQKIYNPKQTYPKLLTYLAVKILYDTKVR